MRTLISKLMKRGMRTRRTGFSIRWVNVQKDLVTAQRVSFIRVYASRSRELVVDRWDGFLDPCWRPTQGSWYKLHEIPWEEADLHEVSSQYIPIGLQDLLEELNL